MTSRFNGDFVVGRYVSGEENVIGGGDYYLSQTYTNKTSMCARQVKKDADGELICARVEQRRYAGRAACRRDVC